MCPNTWKEIHMSLMLWTDSPEAIRAFRREQMRQIEFEPFEELIELIFYLNDKDKVTSEDLSRKDRIYSALITITQQQGSGEKLASTLLWLGLWPALDAIRGRLFRFFNDQEELVSEISAKFTAAIHRANLERINRVAATLVRNTQRDILTGLKCQWAEEKRWNRLRRGISAISLESHVESKWGLPFYVDPEEETQALRVLLAKEVGSEANADLVIWKAVLGETPMEMGARLGIPNGTARKRTQRAFAQTRAVFAKSEEGPSRLATSAARLTV